MSLMPIPESNPHLGPTPWSYFAMREVYDTLRLVEPSSIYRCHQSCCVDNEMNFVKA